MGMLEQLRPGDVLLVWDNNLISWGICQFDGGPAAHAAIVVDANRMAEANWKGLAYTDLTELAKREKIWVRRLGDGIDTGPVTEKAVALADEGAGYAYHQLLLLAGLVLARQVVPGNFLTRKIANYALYHAARLLNSLIQHRSEPMICSEYVYRCYDEAVDTADDPYRLSIPTLRLFGIAGGSLEATAPLGNAMPGSLAYDLLAEPPAARREMLAGILAESEAPLPQPSEVLRQARDDLDPLFARLALEREGSEGASRLEATPLVGGAAAEAAEAPTVRTTMAANDEPVSDEDLRSNGAAFVQALAAPTPTETRSLAAAASSEEAWRTLLQKAADFVTPSDLMKTDSLRTVMEFEGAQV